MKDGAKVFDVGLPLFEIERCLETVVLLGAAAPASEEYDRICEEVGVEDCGEDITMDFGLPLEAVRPGDCDAVLENGLLRSCPGFEAIFGR
jgi:hypothetical protein